ncbi:MAG: NnrU family protein [Rhodocyclaceae bacterium]|nr:MAG: NnrU family protein [Rhodocyclaceae bacterium]
MNLLLLGLIIFLGAHSVRIFAGEWRDAQITGLGEMRWKGVYSLISAVGLGLIIWGFGMARAESPMLWTPPVWTRHLAALLTLPAFILLVAAYLPGSHIKSAVGHPMVAGVKLWALAHLLANGKSVAVVLFGAFLIWAVLDFISARRRDRAAGRTYPVLGWSRDAMVIVVGLVAWGLFAMVGHGWLIGVRPFGV